MALYWQTIVEAALVIYQLGCGYIWGTSGVVWTEAKQREIVDRYKSNPSEYSFLWGSATYGYKWIGKKVYDCSGLVLRICADHGLKLPHSSNAQFLDSCSATGRLKNGQREDGKMLKPGSLVFLYRESDGNRTHVGIYIGDGTVIEAKGGQYGVVKSSVTRFQEWGELRYVNYDHMEKDDSDMETLRKGSSGDAVFTLQKKLNELGYSLEEDGIFGARTQKAVIDFQLDAGLVADGVVGARTWEALKNAKPSGSHSGSEDAGKDEDGKTKKRIRLTLSEEAYNALKEAIQQAEEVEL